MAPCHAATTPKRQAALIPEYPFSRPLFQAGDPARRIPQGLRLRATSPNSPSSTICRRPAGGSTVSGVFRKKSTAALYSPRNTGPSATVATITGSKEPSSPSRTIANSKLLIATERRLQRPLPASLRPPDERSKTGADCGKTKNRYWNPLNTFFMNGPNLNKRRFLEAAQEPADQPAAGFVYRIFAPKSQVFREKNSVFSAFRRNPISLSHATTAPHQGSPLHYRRLCAGCAHCFANLRP